MPDQIAQTHISIQKGTIRDLPKIVKANESIFTGVYEVEPYTLDDYKRRLFKAKPLILIAYDDDTIIGDSIAFPENHTFFIWVLGVNPNYRRQGIATKLFELNEAYARDHGHLSVTTKVLSASTGMLALVKKLGYSVIKFRNDAISPSKDIFYYRIRKQLQTR